jgi:CCR4-NOT complex subunit CAF16
MTMKIEDEDEVVIADDSSKTDTTKANKPIVSIKNLNFTYDIEKGPNIVGLDCVIQPNSQVLLVGANGAGKSTLMRILTGQIFMGLDHDEFDINGKNKANDQANGVAYLGGTWKRRPTGLSGVCPYTLDCAASEMMLKWQNENIERRDELVRVLGINLNWRMHECSDGQRKKVRIMIKLLRPFQLCIIDEFAADLDIFSRSRFFDYLTRECEMRGASVVYATHIFDQADSWATHITVRLSEVFARPLPFHRFSPNSLSVSEQFMQLNKVLSPIHTLKTFPPYQEILARTGAKRAMCPMYVLVLEELERQYRNHSSVFVEDNQCLADVIMDEQSKELGADRHEAERAGDQTGWVSGRLTRQWNAEEQQVNREKRIKENKETKELRGGLEIK